MASILDSSVFRLFVTLLYHGKHWFKSVSIGLYLTAPMKDR